MDAIPILTLIQSCGSNATDQRLMRLADLFETADFPDFMIFLQEHHGFVCQVLNKTPTELLRLFRMNFTWKLLKYEAYIPLSQLKELIRCDNLEETFDVIANATTYEHYLSKLAKVDVARFVKLSLTAKAELDQGLSLLLVDCLSYEPTGTGVIMPVNESAAQVCLAIVNGPERTINTYRCMFSVFKSSNASRENIIDITRVIITCLHHLPEVVFIEIAFLALSKTTDAAQLKPFVQKICQSVVTTPIVRDTKALLQLSHAHYDENQRRLLTLMGERDFRSIESSYPPQPLVDTMIKNAKLLKLIDLVSAKMIYKANELEQALNFPDTDSVIAFICESNPYINMEADDLGVYLNPVVSSTGTPATGSLLANAALIPPLLAARMAALNGIATTTTATTAASHAAMAAAAAAAIAIASSSANAAVVSSAQAAPDTTSGSGRKKGPEGKKSGTG